MEASLILGVMALVFLIVAGCFVSLIVWVVMRFRRGELEGRSPRSGSHHAQSSTSSNDWMSGGSDYSSGP